MASNLKMNRDPTLFPGVNLRTLMGNSELLQSVPNSNRLNVTSNSSSAPKEDQPDKKEESDDVWNYLEAQAAFLGPTLWENGDLKMEYMDLDEFLSENGIPVGESGGHGRGSSAPSSSSQQNAAASVSGSARASSSNDTRDCISPAGSSNIPLSPEETLINDDDESASGSSSSVLDSITPASLTSMHGQRMHGGGSGGPSGKRKRTAVSIASSTNGNTSDDGSYVPGHDFDPKSRPFSQEELRPQPMSKKSKKQYVPDDLKDDKYWARRRKNNMAAKRSRDARRVKENQIAMRAAFLEKEVNAVLRAELDKVSKLYAAALKRLEHYEKPGKKY